MVQRPIGAGLKQVAPLGIDVAGKADGDAGNLIPKPVVQQPYGVDKVAHGIQGSGQLSRVFHLCLVIHQRVFDGAAAKVTG